MSRATPARGHVPVPKHRKCSIILAGRRTEKVVPAFPTTPSLRTRAFTLAVYLRSGEKPPVCPYSTTRNKTGHSNRRLDLTEVRTDECAPTWRLEWKLDSSSRKGGARVAFGVAAVASARDLPSFLFFFVCYIRRCETCNVMAIAAGGRAAPGSTAFVWENDVPLFL